ncbi:MAG TPA: D-glycero-beta-D-manno-heptose 1-phosphate adenylyltransferase [Opitutaceae bacterium]|jgi:rfaE bifunctional protein nucleotidyltransferase chain/domain|nr:D-glycero-beta-D-manno-heptose 1-phosphate adenylyltransferase [Opitutaceae bacterium]
MDSFAYRGRTLTREAAKAEVAGRKAAGQKVVFTNGAFDILHLGHVDYLTFARSQGDCLIVGLNSDASVRRYKGAARPIVPQDERAALLGALRAVDHVVIFDEDEPRDLIAELLPDVLVKGEDWAHYVSGREAVEANGGQVVLAKLVPGRSTTNIVQKILAQAPPRA